MLFHRDVDFSDDDAASCCNQKPCGTIGEDISSCIMEQAPCAYGCHMSNHPLSRHNGFDFVELEDSLWMRPPPAPSLLARGPPEFHAHAWHTGPPGKDSAELFRHGMYAQMCSCKDLRIIVVLSCDKVTL